MILAFDLDGTLIDSRADLAAAVNFMRRSLGLAELSLETIVSFIGNGVEILVRRSLADASHGIDFPTALKLMRDYYAAHSVDETIVYDGVREGLKFLKQQGHTLAIFTNKPEDAARNVLQNLDLGGFAEIIGGMGKYPLKPAPDGLIALKEKYTGELAMLGDNYTDLEAARRAGAVRIYAAWGFGELKGEEFDYRAESFGEFTEIIRRLGK